MQPPWSTAQSTITAPGFIVADHLLGHDAPAPGRPGTSTAPMTRSASATARVDRAAVARERHDAALVDLVDPAQPVEVLVEQQHLGLHALRDPRRVPTDVARAEHDDARRAARRARRRAARRAHRARARGSARRSAAPCGPRPRSSARAAAARPSASCTVSYAMPGRAGARAERVGDVGVRGEVEVGEEHEVGPQVARTPSACGSFTLQHEPGARPHVVGGRRRSRRPRRGSRRR